jgi:hypothetical protein
MWYLPRPLKGAGVAKIMSPPKTPAFQQQVEQLTAAFAAELVRVMKTAIVQSVAVAVGDAPTAPKPKEPIAAAPARSSSSKTASKSTRTAKAAKPAAAKKGGKRSPQAIAKTTDALAAYIAKNPGQRIEEIAKALETATKDLSLPTKKLIAAKKISSKGKRRATTYFPAQPS